MHIRWKQDVAKRLALSARSVAYGDPTVYAGPMYRRATLDKASRTVVLALGLVAEVALALGDTLRLCRLWLPDSPLAMAFSAWPLAASFPQQ